MLCAVCCVICSHFPHMLIGNFSFPGNKWRMGKDSKGRGGFIRDLNANATCETDNKAEMVLTLNITIHDMIQHTHNINLNLQYLRGYFNGGRIVVVLCDTSQTTEGLIIHSLWDDYTVFTYTVVTSFSVELNRHHCNNIQHRHEHVTVKLRHIVAGCDSDKKQVYRQDPHGNQMFKLMAMNACHLE